MIIPFHSLMNFQTNKQNVGFYFILYKINLLVSESSHLAQLRFLNPTFIILGEKTKRKTKSWVVWDLGLENFDNNKILV